MTVRMTDFPWTLGRPSMKSVEMSAHTRLEGQHLVALACDASADKVLYKHTVAEDVEVVAQTDEGLLDPLVASRMS